MKIKKSYQIIILIFIIILSQLISLFIYPHIFGNGISCFWRGCFGIPCPGCGMTRAFFALIKGDFHRAFDMHPFIFILPFITISYLYYYFIKKNNKIANRILIFFMLMFILLWIIRMFLYFPNHEPMNGYDSHLFHF